MTRRAADTRSEVLADLAERAAAQAPAPLYVACGLGGGGESVARGLLAALGGCEPVERKQMPSLDDGPATVVYRTVRGLVIDDVACSGIGPGTDATPSVRAKDDFVHDGPCIVLVRDAAKDAHPLSFLVGRDAERRLFCDLLRDECGIADERAVAVVKAFGYPTALIPELRALRDDWAEASSEEIVRACSHSHLLAELRRAVQTRGGRSLLDLGRVLCLMTPQEMELSDEWALLAGALAGRIYAISDIVLALHECSGLFHVRLAGDRTVVAPASRLAYHLLLGDVPPSTSENFSIYRVLRARCVALLGYGEGCDHFLARQLPKQARAANALNDLISDPAGVLSSEPLALLRELEADSILLRTPHAKIISLAAHRLMSDRDRASQLELSARRMGAHEFADRLAGQMTGRRWKPILARAQPAHVHRVALNRRAPLLALGAADDPCGSVFVGCAEAEVWRMAPYERAVRLSGSDELDGEIRAIAASAGSDGSCAVAVGTSTHAVAVLDGRNGTLLWLDSVAHEDPLSAVEVLGDQNLRVISAGVGGQICSHPLTDGEGKAEIICKYPSEIRCLRALRVRERDLIVFCAVDGHLGLILYDDRQIVALWHLGEEVLNSAAAAVEGEMLRLVAGGSTGNVHELSIGIDRLCSVDSSGSPLRAERWPVVGQHMLAVNGVQLVRRGCGNAILSGSSDGAWKLHDSESTLQLGLGHVGPIWAVVATETDGRTYFVTAGGEGACRLWLADAVVGESIAHIESFGHRSAVSALELVARGAESGEMIVGESDGSIRRVAPQSEGGEELVTRHDGEISGIVSINLVGRESHIVSASSDGTLRLTPLDPRRRHESSILGIAHDGVTALCLGPGNDGRYVVSGGLDGTIMIWDLLTRAPRNTIEVSPYGAVQALCRIEDRGEEKIVVGGQDGGLSIHQPLQLQQCGERITVEAGVLCICPLPGLTTGVVAGLENGKVAIARELGTYRQSVKCLDISDNEIRGIGVVTLGGRVYVACAGLDRRLRLFDLQIRKVAVDIELDGFALSLMAVGQSLAVGTSAGAAMILYGNSVLEGRLGGI